MVKRATSGIWCMSKQTLFDFESSHFPLSMALISFSCSLRSLAFCQFVWHKQTFNWCHEQKQCVIVETNSTPSAYRFNDRYREGPPKKNRERAERRIITILKLNWAHDDNTHTQWQMSCKPTILLALSGNGIRQKENRKHDETGHENGWNKDREHSFHFSISVDCAMARVKRQWLP